MNSYLCQYRQHRQSAVFWAANEDKRTGIDTEKIATHTSTPTQKNMHKIRLYIVFISIRASQKCCLCPRILVLCFCFYPIFRAEVFFIFFLFRCCCRLKWMHLADCVMDLRAEEKTSNLLRYSSIHWRSLTAIFKKKSQIYCNAFRRGHCILIGVSRCQHQGKDNRSILFKNPPQHSYWNSF